MIDPAQPGVPSVGNFRQIAFNGKWVGIVRNCQAKGPLGPPELAALGCARRRQLQAAQHDDGGERILRHAHRGLRRANRAPQSDDAIVWELN
jgi:hypothetical protein